MSTVTAPATGHVVLAPRTWKTPIIHAVLAVITVVFFGFFAEDADVMFGLSDADDPIYVPDLGGNARVIGIAAGVLMLVATAWAFKRAYDRKKVPLWLSIGVGFLFLVALLGSVGAGGRVPVVFLLTGAIGLSAAVIFGALAGVIGERVGVANIAIEGQLLLGAFCAASIGSLTGNLYIGIVAAMIGGALVSLVLASFSIKYLVDQIIVGVVLNALVIGLTNFLYAAVLNTDPTRLNNPGTLPFLPIPFLSDIPVLGPVLFNQRITTYVMFLLIPTVWFVLFKTRLGLRIRALGEHPLAADTVGIDVNRTRFWTVTAAGLIAGFGGAALTLGSVGAFVREMSAGQGYIALACVILGRWNPWLAACAALLYGFARNFRIWAGQAGSEIPPDLIAAIPYVVTVLAVALLVGRAVAPAAVGKPYIKG